MRALICAASVLGVLAFVAWTGSPAGAQSDDDDVPTIKEIMAKLHKGAKAPLNAVKAELKSESPDWTKVEVDAKIIDKFGTLLTKTDPPKGSKASYEKLTKAYASSAKALEDAAEKQDLPKAREATKKLGGSCQACHKAHKG